MTDRLFFTLALMLSAGAMLPAQPPPPQLDVMRDLDLTETQRQSIHTILEGHRASSMAKRQALETKVRALREALDEEATTEAQLRELHAAAGEARFATLLEERATMLEIQAVLTPAQRAKLKAQREKMGPGPGGRPEGPGAPFRP